MWWNDSWWPMHWFGFGPIVMILFMLVCMLMMWSMMRGHRSHDVRPSDILKERYARGEITASEYEEGRRVLGA